MEVGTCVGAGVGCAATTWVSTGADDDPAISVIPTKFVSTFDAAAEASAEASASLWPLPLYSRGGELPKLGFSVSHNQVMQITTGFLYKGYISQLITVLSI